MFIGDYFRLAIVFVIIVNILYLPILFTLKKRGKNVIRQLSFLALFLSALLIVFVTIILFNIPINFKPEQYVLNLIPFQRFREENINILKTVTTEIIPNIMLFIPLGFFIPIALKK